MDHLSQYASIADHPITNLRKNPVAVYFFHVLQMQIAGMGQRFLII
jgi:hypothetical protein